MNPSRGTEVVQALFVEILEEMDRNPRFAAAVERALTGTAGSPTRAVGRRGGRRAPGVLDPFAVLAEGGESGLHRRLAELDLEQLRDIVAEHGMDTSKLAMRWKSPERVVSLIVSTVAERAVKGHAFRTPPADDDVSAPPPG